MPTYLGSLTEGACLFAFVPTEVAICNGATRVRRVVRRLGRAEKHSVRAAHDSTSRVPRTIFIEIQFAYDEVRNQQEHIEVSQKIKRGELPKDFSATVRTVGNYHSRPQQKRSRTVEANDVGVEPMVPRTRHACIIQSSGF